MSATGRSNSSLMAGTLWSNFFVNKLHIKFTALTRISSMRAMSRFISSFWFAFFFSFYFPSHQDSFLCLFCLLLFYLSIRGSNCGLVIKT